MVEERPGIRTSTLYHAAGLAFGTGHHHVAKLIEAGLIHDRRDGRCRRLYPGCAPGCDPVDAEGALLLRSTTARTIAQAIARKPGIGLQPLVTDLGLEASHARYHIRRLVRVGLLKKPEGRIYCSLVPTPRLLALLPKTTE